MAWIVGNQESRPSDDINALLKTKTGQHLEDREAKILLYRFLLENLTYTANMVMGVDLFPFQHMAVKGMFKSDYFLGIWCLNKDEYVLSENGFKKIQNIEIGEKVRSRKGLNLVLDKKFNTKSKGLEITTQNGDFFSGKLGHRVLTYNPKTIKFEFKQIQNLEIGDILPVKKGMDQWGDYNPCLSYQKSGFGRNFVPQNSKSFYFFLGYILGGGYIDQNGAHFCTQDKEIVDRVYEFAKSFELKPYLRERKDGFFEGALFNRSFVNWLKEIGFDPELKARAKVIPDNLLMMSKENSAALISGLFSADGYCSVRKDKRHNNSYSIKLGMKSCSLLMLRQVKFLLLNFGIESSLRRSGSSKHGDYYDLVIASNSLRLFQQYINFGISYKRDNLAKAIDELDEYLYLKVGHLEKESVYFSKIKSIVPCEIETVDITVDKEENYIGAGFVHHNSRGLSKCLNINNLVITEEGIKKAGDVNVGEHIQAKNQMCKVMDKTVNPKDETYKVISQKGYESEGLDYHRILVLDKDLTTQWKYAKDVKIGDVVVMRKNYPFPVQKDIFADIKQDSGPQNKRKILNLSGASVEDWYYFFGLLLGDGHIKKNKRGVCFCSEDDEIQNFLISFAVQIGLTCLINNKQKTSAKTISINSINLVSVLFQLGFDHAKAYKKSIPQGLLCGGKKSLSNLLQGLFDTDGYCSVQNKKEKNAQSVIVGFTSASDELIKQVRSLLLNFGVVSKTSATFKGGESTFGNKSYDCHKAWSVIITSFENLFKFSEIGFRVKRKQEKLNLISKYKYTNGEFSDYIPYIGEFLIHKYNKKSFCKTGKKLNFRKMTSRRLGQKLVDSPQLNVEDAAKIKSLLDENLFFDTVQKVSKLEAVTVDLAVEKEHCYVSDGFINHNSWSTGIFAALYAIFNQGVNIGILSKTFRQCCRANTLVPTNRGFLKIEDLNVGDYIFSEKSHNKVLNKWKNPPQPILKLQSKRGYKIEGIYEHQVLCLDTVNQDKFYKNLKDIRSGDIVAIQTNLDTYHISATKKQLDNAYLCGLIIGDGYISKKNNLIDIVTNDWEIEDFVVKFARDNNIKITTRTKHGQTKSLRVYSRDFISLLFSDYDHNKKAHEKFIPDSWLQWSKQELAAFLSGLFDADGCAQEDRVELAISSIRLAEQVQQLLLLFGIVSKIQKENARGKIKICGVDTFGKESYKVRITGQKFIGKFKRDIGFKLLRKQNKIVSLKDRGNYDVIMGVGQYLHSKYKFPEHFPSNMGKSRLKRVLDKYSDVISKDDQRKLSELALLYWDKVLFVEPSAEEVTIDVEVEKEHCYTGNGFINHNSKHIFRKIEDISKTPDATFLQQCITHISRSNDEWIMEIGRSKIIALPLGDGEKLRGFRFHAMIIDELLLMPEKILNEVIMPFLSTVEDPTVRQKMYDAETEMIEAGLMKEEDRMQWPSNKLIGLSSASYKFEYLYKLYTEYEDLIMHPEKAKEKDKELENVHRVIMHLSYDVAPTKLYDQKLISQSKATMSQAQFEREFGSKFTDDSSGYFKISKMAACSIQDGQPPSVEIVGEPKEEYILAVDPSWSESDTSDDFAMQVIKLDKQRRKGILIHSYAMSGTNLKKHIAYLMYVLEHFNIVQIIMDYNGGVQFLSAVNESALFKDKKIKINVIEDVDFDDPTGYEKDLREFKRKYNKTTNTICLMRKPSSGWIRIANESLQGAFDHKRMLFAGMAMDDDYYKQVKANPDISQIVFLREDELHETANESRVVDFLEVQKDNIELTKTECALIEVSTSPQGNQTFDLPLSLRKLSGRNKARKDSYSALLLGNWMMERHFDIEAFKEPSNSTFIPEIIK